MDDCRRDVTYDYSAPTEPVVAATWRGKFNIPSRSINIHLAAHVSNKACLKVWEAAKKLPESLCMEVFPRLDIWPASFNNLPPSVESIALFFFPMGRDERLLDSLLTDAICSDFAFKAMIDDVELLIFTSLELPLKLQRYQGKHYLWGIFREKQGDSSHQSPGRIHIRKKKARYSLSPESGHSRSFEDSGNPIDIFPLHQPLLQAAQVDKKGRQLDDAWKHAKPLDELRQKAECRYCGFVSSLGGISRLKAHLGGGNPIICLPGCDRVPPEVQRDMAEWFSEWVKNSKALWTKEIQAQNAEHADRRGRPHDAAWYHANPLDMARQKAECRYCGFISSHGGISRLKAHLAGGDPKVHVGACPKVPPDIKEVMSEWLQNSNASKMDKKSRAAGASSERRGRPLDDAWNHAKPLDEARQKTQCKYCGFVSLHGGISRLKAHLGGGCPEKQLQGCPKVPLEVRRVMQQWFSEWSENSMASWIKKSPGSVRSVKRGKHLDDTWEHGIPLDKKRQCIRCKYCNFVSNHGGVACLKAHLSGGDLSIGIEGCPNMMPEVKVLMGDGVNKCTQVTNGAWFETVGVESRESGRTGNQEQWVDKRHHILQETLYETKNTSLKSSLQKLLEKKNMAMQKMQSDIVSLENHLASIP